MSTSAHSVLSSMRTLDLTPIAFKLSGCKEGHCWSPEKTNHGLEQYRHWLALVAMYPDRQIIPTKVIDEVWHLHILDTSKYMEDMERVLGYYLHHFPYFGMRGADDRRDLETAFESTQVLLEEHFGINFTNFSDGRVTEALCGPENCEPSCTAEKIGMAGKFRPWMDARGVVSLHA